MKIVYIFTGSFLPVKVIFTSNVNLKTHDQVGVLLNFTVHKIGAARALPVFVNLATLDETIHRPMWLRRR